MTGGAFSSVMNGPALLASADMPAGVDGLFYGGGLHQLWVQFVAVVAVMAYTGVVTALIALGIKAVMGVRADAQHEADGLDEHEHAESAYDFAVGHGGSNGPGLFGKK